MEKEKEEKVRCCGDCRWNNFGYCSVFGGYVRIDDECFGDKDDFERDEENGA